MSRHIWKITVELKNLKVVHFENGADMSAVGGGRGSQREKSIVQMLDTNAIHLQSSPMKMVVARPIEVCLRNLSLRRVVPISPPWRILLFAPPWKILLFADVFGSPVTVCASSECSLRD